MNNSNQLQLVVVCGLGLMSSPMARYWRDQSQIKVLRVHDRGRQGSRRDKCRQAWKENGAQLVSTFEDLIGNEKLDGVFICAGKNGDDFPIIANIANLLSKKFSGAFICHLSTVNPDFVKAADQFCTNKKVHYVNYPLTGGPNGAETANMLILAGGNTALYEKLEPALSLIGKPQYFGSNIAAGTEVKLIGHLMVFNGLVGICSAAAVHAESFNNGSLGGENQAAFFEFLNQGAGKTNQWEIALSNGIKRDDWSAGFLIKYALVDAIYAIKMCLEYKVSWLIIQPIINVALAFSYVMHKVGSDLATQAIAREMIAERSLSLDQFLMQHSATPGDSQEALQKCMDALPDDLREIVKLNITSADFEKASVPSMA